MSAVELSTPSSEPVAVEGVEVFQAAFEHAGSRGDAFLPKGLVPTIPTLVTLVGIRAPDGPAGPFTLAQVRVSCRSGARARALVVATAVAASDETAEWLSGGWGIGANGNPNGGVTYRRDYHRAHIAAPWFDVSLDGPRPIGVHDVQYVTELHPVSTPSGPRLVQVELEVSLDRVERGRPTLHRFAAPDTAAGLDPRFPMVATSGVGTLTLPAIRFLLQPDVPPPAGTERVTQPATT